MTTTADNPTLTNPESESNYVPSAEATARLDEIERDGSAVVGDETSEIADTTEPTTGDEPTAAEAPVTTWIDDDVKALAKTYGLPEESLGKFTDRASFDQASLFYDQQLIAQATAQAAQQQGQVQQQTTTEAAPAEPAKPANPVVAPAADAPAELQGVLQAIAAITPEAYGDELAGFTKGLGGIIQQQHNARLALENEVRQLREFANWQMEQVQRQQAHHDFNQLNAELSALDVELFGESLEKATPAQRDARVQAVKQLDPLRQIVSQQQGYIVPIDKALVTRAYRVAFGDKIAERAKKQVTAAIRQQSGKRLGGATRQQAPKTPLPASGDMTEDAELLTLTRGILDKYNSES